MQVATQNMPMSSICIGLLFRARCRSSSVSIQEWISLRSKQSMDALRCKATLRQRRLDRLSRESCRVGRSILLFLICTIFQIQAGIVKIVHWSWK